MKTYWEKEHHRLENVLAKHCMSAVGDAEGEPTTFQKNGVLHAATERQRGLDDIRGRLKTLTGKNPLNAKILKVIEVSLINSDKD